MGRNALSRAQKIRPPTRSHEDFPIRFKVAGTPSGESSDRRNQSFHPRALWCNGLHAGYILEYKSIYLKVAVRICAGPCFFCTAGGAPAIFSRLRHLIPPPLPTKRGFPRGWEKDCIILEVGLYSELMSYWEHLSQLVPQPVFSVALSKARALMRSGKSPAGDWASPDKNWRRLGCLKNITGTLRVAARSRTVAIQTPHSHPHYLQKKTEKKKKTTTQRKKICCTYSRAFIGNPWISL
jgi:hypothetical protein